MKIVGGNFGATGSALVENGQILLSGATSHLYQSHEITSINSSMQHTRKFGCIGFVIGGMILGLLLGAAFGPIGAIFGIIIALAGSFYTNSQTIVTVTFMDGKNAQLACSPRQSKLIHQLQNK